MILESKFYSNQFKNYFDQSYQLAEKKKQTNQTFYWGGNPKLWVWQG